MVLVIGIILAFIVLITIGLILRKRVYDRVDQLESWKMDIMGRSVAAELSKIKSLNLTGDTQEKFEAWKSRWEHIITKELPDIEEHLFDAEEAADRFRTRRAKSILNEGEAALQAIEKSISAILEELEELLESEETGRKEAEELEPEIRLLRKKLSQARYQYGKAEKYFDNELDSLESKLAGYHDLVEAGDYLDASKHIKGIKEETEALEQKMDEFPKLYKLCRHDLPSQLDNLLSGIRDMEEEGYRVSHLGFEKEIYTYQERISDILRKMETGDISDTETMISDIEERMKEMYELLEKEALARNYLEAHIPEYKDSLEDLISKFDETKLEVDQIKKAYYVENNDMDRFLAVGKTITKMREQLYEVSQAMEMEGKSHSELREQIEDGFGKIEELQDRHEEFKKSIQNLRKDEMEAREKLTEMRTQIANLNRRLKKSNIPGVPNFIWSSLENAVAKNGQVIKALDKYPLDMAAVQQALAAAQSTMEQCAEQVEMMLDQAYLTEQVIQYANRYRSKDPALAKELAESERLFRSFEYELSLEKAAKAVEEVEPGALKRIEKYQTVMNS